jgi:hypothetical protein
MPFHLFFSPAMDVRPDAGSAIISIAWHGHCSKQAAQPVHLS